MLKNASWSKNIRILYFFIVNKLHHLKGTLMQIWKSSNMFVFIKKQYLGKFAFLILIIFELFAQIWLIFILNVCKQTFHIPYLLLSQSLTRVLMWNLRHIIFIWRWRLADSQICINVPLIKSITQEIIDLLSI